MSPQYRQARIAVWVGVASIFLFNVILGPLAVVFGALSMRRGERRLGRMAVILGVIGTVVGILLLVLVSNGVLPDFEEMLREMKRTKE